MLTCAEALVPQYSATMTSSQLLVLSLFLAFPGLSDANLLRKLVEDLARAVGAEPERTSSRGSLHLHGGPGPQQAADPLLLAFPTDQGHVAPTKPLRFALHGPTKTDNVAVRCGKDAVNVEVSQHLLGTGRLVAPDEMTLGGCPATLADDSSEVLTFRSQLHGCNSKLVMTNDRIIYAFKLLYRPKSWRHVPIARSMDAAVGVECHYSRVFPAG